MKTETALATIAAPLLFCIPEQDQDEFQRLPNRAPNDIAGEVDQLLVEFEGVFNSGKYEPALRELAGKLSVKGRGWSFGSLRRKFYLYKDGGRKSDRYFERGDWRCLVDYSRCTKSQKAVDAQDEADVNLPKDFVAHLQGLMQSNNRKSEPAIRMLYRQWKAGESIPGYGTWQEWFMDKNPFHPLPEECPPDLPHGWSRGNLRRYIPEDAELALARRGVAEARNHLPDIIQTRDGLRPLELIQFDDVRTDFKILVPDYGSPVELNLLVAMDVATGMILRFGLRPGIQREDGIKDKLKLRDMKTLVAGILTTFGVPKDYTTTYCVENATAALKEGTAMALSELSCKRIEVHRTMMIQGTAIWGGYKDRAIGNPKGKGNLESTFNLLHNESGFLPGQTGRRYDQGPMELTGRTVEATALTKISNRYLNPFQRAALKLPFLNYDEARVVLEAIFRQIMTREDHKMESFRVIGEWRAAQFQQWRPETDLLLPECAHLDANKDIEWRNPARLETPLERWQRLRDEVGGDAAFTKIHPGAIMRLFEEHAKKAIDNSEIVFRFKNETFAYRIANVQNAKRALKNRMEVLAYFDRADMSFIHLTDGEGGYLGSIPRTRGARKLDKEAMAEQFAEQRAEFKRLQARVSERMPKVPEQHLEQLEHNNAVIRDALADAEAVNVAEPVNAIAEPAAPAVARDLMRARLAQQVAARQGEDAAAQEAELTPPPAAEDCTADLLSEE